jgi:cephalosporin hydroxylase
MTDVYIDIDASVKAMGSEQGCLLFDVPAMKGLEDLRRYQRVIQATQPDLIIQTGTAVGGSAMWFAYNWFAYDGPHVITIDVNGDQIDPRVLESDWITTLIGSSTAEHIVNSVKSLASMCDRVMVILDSDHSGPHVRDEIRLYGPLVTEGCYLVVEDGVYDFAPDSPFNPGPFDAIEACLAGNDGWERDVEVEAMDAVSMYPAGWWIKREDPQACLRPTP